jgi:hypothetical protein
MGEGMNTEEYIALVLYEEIADTQVDYTIFDSRVLYRHGAQ